VFDPTPLQNFMARVRTAANMNSKDIKLTTAEALEISACLVQILAAQVAQKTVTARQEPAKTVLDGGGFK
jgi:hypothetical protein